MQVYHPDYHPSSPRWGKYLVAKMKEAGIDLKRKSTSFKPTQDPNKKSRSVRILGESHSLNETGMFVIQQIEKAAKEGFSTVTFEEPKDGSLGPLMSFLLQLPPKSSKKEILESAHEFSTTPQTANRLSALAYARQLNLVIEFVDIETNEKSRRYKLEGDARRRRVAHGEPFDPKKPETAEGGIRIAAANLLASYHNTRRRSVSMAKNILAIDSHGKILHVGGALHTLDIAFNLQKLSKGGIFVETRFGPMPDHPILREFGKIPKSEGEKLKRIDNPCLE